MKKEKKKIEVERKKVLKILKKGNRLKIEMRKSGIKNIWKENTRIETKETKRIK